MLTEFEESLAEAIGGAVLANIALSRPAGGGRLAGPFRQVEADLARARLIAVVKARPHRAVRIGSSCLVVTMSEVDGSDQISHIRAGRSFLPSLA